MALATTHELLSPQFEALRYAVLRQLEGNEQAPYLDTARNIVLPTIGIGFNLTVPSVRDNVLDVMQLSEAEKTAVRAVIADMQYRVFQPGESESQRAARFRAALEVALGRPFTMTDTQIRTVFELEVASRQQSITLSSGVGPSYELLALLSAEYNNLYGNRLRAALAAGKRAEAWYELRYGFLAGQNVKRRIAEGALFGLYEKNATVSSEEARSIYQTLQLHRGIIESRDATYDGFIAQANLDLAAAGVPQSAQGLDAELARARHSLIAAIRSMDPFLNARDFTSVSALNVYLDAGRTDPNPNAELEDIDLNRNAYINSRRSNPAGEIVADDILIGGGGNDTLISAGGNDTLIGDGWEGAAENPGDDTLDGGAGDDVLFGGAGDDALRGGAGNDTYVFRREEEGIDFDRIMGDDNDGLVVIDGVVLTGQGAEAIAHPVFSGRPAWREELNGRQIDYVLVSGDLLTGGTLWIMGEGIGLGDVIAIESYRPGDLGLNLPIAVGNTLMPESITVNPFADPDFVPTQSTTGLSEGRARTVTFATNLPTQAGRLVRLEVPAGIAGALRVVTGAETLEFAGGLVELTIPAGQTLLTFSLLAQGDVDTDQNFNLIATLLNADGTPSGASATLAVNYDATEEVTPSTGFTVNGDVAARVVNNVILYDRPPGVSTAFPAHWFGNVVADGVSVGRSDRIMGSDGADLLNGLGGNDVVVGADGDDIIDGGDGVDFIAAGRGADVVNGGDGDDLILGGASYVPSVPERDDEPLSPVQPPNGYTVVGTGWTWSMLRDTNGNLVLGVAGSVADETSLAATADGDDRIDAGAGDDNVDAGYGNDVIVGGVGNDRVTGGAGSDRIDGGDGDDLIRGDILRFSTVGGSGETYPSATHGVDFLSGGAGNDTMTGDGGNDTLLGGDGADILHGDTADTTATPLANHGADFLDGGAGNDQIDGGGGADALFGGADDDLLIGDSEDENAGNDYLDGETGNDTLYGAAGADRLLGGDGNDNLYGDSPDNAVALQGDDYLDGGAGNDVLLGAGGADTLLGGDGADQMSGDSGDTNELAHGDDYLSGGAGNDVLIGDGGSDRLFGGADDDQLFGEGATTPESRQGGDYLDGGSGNDTLVGAGGADTLLGGEGNDTLTGDSAQTPSALHGDDTLDGGVGNDTLIGGGGADTLAGGEGDDILAGDSSDTPESIQGNDVLDGGEGDDVLQGYRGNDTLFGGTGDDALLGMEDDDTLDGGDGLDELFGGAGADLLAGGADADTLSGGDGADVLTGGEGSDLLVGGAGNDVLDGGEERDVYVYTAGSGEDRIVDSGGNTLQFDFSSAGLQLGLGSLTLSFAGRPGDVIHLDGFDADDPYGNIVIDRFEFTDRVMTYDEVLALGFNFQGTPDADFLEGTALADRIQGLASDDTLIGKDGADELDGGEGADLLVGGDGGDQLLGAAGDDSLLGDAGNDTLDGGAGADTLYGGAGNDTFAVDDAGDAVTEFAGEGTDTVQASITHTLAANVENLTLTGAAAINGTGNALANILTGNSADNRLDGASGADSMAGGAGNDTYVVDSVSDLITETAGNGTDTVESSVTHTLAAEVENLTLTGVAAINGIGNALANVITGNSAGNILSGLGGDDTLIGNAGNDTLEGGTGNDTLTGAAGNDTYRVGSAGDIILESADEGIDVVEATVSYTLAANVENLTLLGSTSINGTGNDLANVINGNIANNVLSGLGGNDTLNGSAGNDTLDGGTGADTMAGGASNDTYIVDDAADIVNETSTTDSGDRVEASVSYALSSSARIETFVLTGTAAINASGNAFNTAYIGNDAANVITDTAGGSDSFQGNGGNDTLIAGSGFNTLNGGTGDDTMSGGAGNDTYIVDSAADVVIENAGEGTDTVQASATYTLAVNVENLTLTGIAAINGTGNDLNNLINGNSAGNVLSGLGGNDTLTGNNGDDTLDGGTGNDTLFGSAGNDTLLGGDGNDFFFDSSGNNTMAGGAGDDIYDISDSTANIIVENAGAGIDRVDSLVSYTLGANVENLTLENSTESLEEAPNGTGNALDNVIAGNDFRNVLDGLDGNDTLDGRSGNDTLLGGAGNDTLFGGIDAGGTGFDPRNEIPFTRPIENDDLLNGGAGNDALDGGSGNDTLLGGDGVDTLIGGADGPLNTSNNDILDGGAGLDTMAGGTGNDTYYVDGTYTDLPGEPTLDECGLPITGPTRRVWTADTITENANQGYDVVYSSASITLPDNIEEVILQGTDNLDATAGAGAQILLGNSGNNRLDGGAGADSLTGGAGNDTHIVDQSGDVVTEAAASGTDTVESSIDYTLGANLERLVLLAGATQGFGNALDNTLIGNAASNRLEGATGNDALNGGAGDDELYGGEGDDTYYFGAGSGEDVVFDLQGLNRVRVLGTLTANDVTLTESGDDLILTINGTNDRLTLTGWVTVEALHSGNATFCLCGCPIQLEGCSGGETIVGTSANEVLNGTPCADDITGGGGSDQLLGNGGNDTLRVHYWDDCWTGSETSAAGLALAGAIRTFDVFNGGDGADTLIGTQDGDAILLEDEISQRPAGTSGARIIGVETINAGDGDDIVDLSSDLYTYGPVTIDGGADDDTLWANSGNDVLLGGTGNDWLIGDAGNDFQLGGTGDDWLWDEEGLGNDVMQGEAGDDQLLDNAGQNLFDGGAGADQITDGGGNSLFVGGAGDDFINTGAGNDIVLYNIGDGVDTVRSWEGEGADNVLSLGGTIDYSQLYFSRSGDDLVLETDTNGRIVLEGWYYHPGYPSVDRLQVVTELMSGYNQAGSNPLLDDKVETFDFEALVAAFDAAQAANPALTHWALTNALTQFHLGGSDTEALGGDLAYQYGVNGSLAGIGLAPAHDVIGASTFGTSAQTLRPRASLEVGSLRLV